MKVNTATVTFKVSMSPVMMPFDRPHTISH